MSRVLLVDGTNVVMRFAHAMMPKGSIEVADAEALAGDVSSVLNAVLRTIRECADTALASYAVVALDSGDSWRKQVFPGYKASRVVRTHWWSRELASRCAAESVQTADCYGYEADDVIATLARRLHGASVGVAVLSGDSDLLALAADSCTVYQFGGANEPRHVIRSPAWICAKYGIESASHLTPFKAIVGEPGDDLPGVDGFGPVKARKILRGTLGWITDEQQRQFELMVRLVTLESNAPVPPMKLADCRIARAA